MFKPSSYSFLMSFAFFLSFLGGTALGFVQEASSLKQLSSFIGPQTVVVIDLDNTVMESRQTLGSDQFFGYLVKKLQAQGFNEKQAVHKALSLASPIQPYSQVQPVEKFTPAWIEHLQKNKIQVFALTARPYAWANGTLNQLHSLGINLNRTSPLNSDGNSYPKNAIKFRNGVYHHGVFFISEGLKKGPALIEFLKATNGLQRPIMFIDDKVANVESVNNALNPVSKSHVEFRYGAADARVKSFNPNVAEFQWRFFHQYRKFISDEETEKILGQAPKP